MNPSNTSSTALEVFSFQGHEIPVFGTYENPLFIARHVCEVLALDWLDDVRKRIPEWTKGLGLIAPTLGGSQEMATITEAGVYWIAFRSNKPEAQEFTRWICEDVLPSIRKHGFYLATGGEPVAAIKVRDCRDELAAAELDLQAEEIRRRIIARKTLPGAITVKEWLDRHVIRVTNQEGAKLGWRVRCHARKHNQPTGSVRNYGRSVHTYAPTTISAALANLISI